MNGMIRTQAHELYPHPADNPGAGRRLCALAAVMHTFVFVGFFAWLDAIYRFGHHNDGGMITPAEGLGAELLPVITLGGPVMLIGLYVGGRVLSATAWSDVEHEQRSTDWCPLFGAPPWHLLEYSIPRVGASASAVMLLLWSSPVPGRFVTFLAGALLASVVGDVIDAAVRWRARCWRCKVPFIALKAIAVGVPALFGPPNALHQGFFTGIVILPFALGAGLVVLPVWEMVTTRWTREVLARG